MPRKRRVPVHLAPAATLARADLALVLRAADSIIANGGRTVVTQILKGSRDKRLLEYRLDSNPAYGSMKDRSREEVASLVDRAIVDGYLEIRYDKDLPMLIFTARGWDLERKAMVTELLAELDRKLENGPPYDMTHLVNRNREMILDLLDAIEASRRPELRPLLFAWRDVDHRKVRTEIDRVLKSLRKGPTHIVSQ